MHRAPSQRPAWDRFPVDVAPAAIQSVLSYFGIQDHINVDGTRTWVIDLQRESSASPNQQIWFDEPTRSWKLRDTVSSPYHPQPSDRSPVEPTQTDQTVDSSVPVAKPTISQPVATLQWYDRLPNTNHCALFRSVDWGKTSLGPLQTWPHALRLYTYMILSQQGPAALYWGDDYISIYNEGIIPIIGQYHPSFMGRAFFETWQELKQSFSVVFKQITTTGLGIELIDYNAFLERHGYTEETWWRGNLFPLEKDEGGVGGCCFIWNEVTRQVLSDRRTQLLNEFGHFDPNAHNNIWDHILVSMRRTPRDIAMAMCYAFGDDEGEDDDPSGERVLFRKGVVGIGTDHVAAPEQFNLDTCTSGLAPWIRESLSSDQGWTAVNVTTDNLDERLLEGIDWQGYGEPSKEIIFMPLKVLGTDLKGVVVVGLNPRRTFDADHRQFVMDMHRQLVTIMSFSTSQIHAKKREAQLVSDLAESEKRIRLLAELAPMGLFDLSTDGRMRWANSHYFSIMGITRPSDIGETAWIEPVDPEDLVRVKDIFQTCIENETELSGTVRLSRKWQPPQPANLNDEHSQVHIFFQAFPYKEDGVTTSIMGSITDVSRFVWAESVSANAAQNAQQERARQEEFVDIISHELRNPLSAITQCADGILQSLKELGTIKAGADHSSITESCKEAADTILLCASHQKRIVDDVLTLSKLDSNLITLTPVSFRPSSIQQEVVQMFQYDFAVNNITTIASFENHSDLSTCYVFGDASRISQVLVNLVTNAIKYQKEDGEHKIVITSGLSLEAPEPSRFGQNFRWSESGKTYDDVSSNPGYGDGEVVYLHFSVQDTGLGLPSEKAVQIFDKFVQANRRSHSKYGGSGLGLYISRQLTEMQSGLIGIASEAHVGSTFAFYAKLRRAPTPAPDTQTASHPPDLSSLKLDSPISLLLVEDNLINQKVLAKQLRNVGYVVFVANHGGEAIDFLLKAYGHSTEYGTTMSAEAHRVDCVLMDWEMPILDGLATTTRIRELERLTLISDKQTIIGITANARNEQIEKAMGAGMNAVVTKPFHISDLVAQISKTKQPL